MRHLLKISLLSFATMGILLVGGRYARADAITTDFENFTLGAVNGQGGWQSGGTPPSHTVFDEAVVANTYGYPSFGTKSLRLSNAITSVGFGDQTFSSPLINEAGETSAAVSPYPGGVRQPYFSAQWDFASTVPNAEQPGLSITASPDRGDGSRMSWIQMEDTPTGLQLNFDDYQIAVGDFVMTPIATGLDRSVPHTVKVTMQFIDGPSNDIVQVYLDGALIHTGTSWEDYARAAGGATDAVDRILFRVGGTAAPANMGNGFLIDNFSSYSGPVPSLTPPATPSGSLAPKIGTITVVKLIVNANGGTKTPNDFSLFVNGTPVDSGISNAFPAPADTYRVTGTADPNYASTFSGDCDATGGLSLSRGDTKVCVVTNTYDGPTTAVVAPVPPLIDVIKTASPSALPNGPGDVTYTYTIKNIGTVPVIDITMIGDTCRPIVLASGDANNNNVLDTNETWIYKCTTKISETHTNTVVAAGWANGLVTSSIASATVMVGTPLVPPLIHVTMIPSPLDLSDDGGSVIYTEKVTNPGTVPLSGVNITDNVCSTLKYVSGDTNNDSKLDPSETWTYTCQVQLSKTSTSTSVAYGTGNGSTARDITLATVVVAAPASALDAPVKMIKTDLSQGDKGDNVKALQNFLMSDIAEKDDVAPRALAKAGATGYFGALTRAALAEFQKDVGVKPAVGYFGPITRAYLNAHY
jgi:uncharacterized repeat protein (TIGR01451 family)